MDSTIRENCDQIIKINFSQTWISIYNQIVNDSVIVIRDDFENSAHYDNI